MPEFELRDRQFEQLSAVVADVLGRNRDRNGKHVEVARSDADRQPESDEIASVVLREQLPLPRPCRLSACEADAVLKRLAIKGKAAPSIGPE